ncbi:MAG: low specificity L-threonine aldolase [Hyphomicrobiales bacterium]
MKSFASDNWSGVSPEILKTIENANTGHSPAYGELNDPYTESAISQFKKTFGEDIEVFFVYNGTGANILSIQNTILSCESVVCPETAHINEDECGAPEKITGSKINAFHSEKGKLNIQDIECLQSSIGFQHHNQPRMISISQVTELGTIYTAQEIRAIADYAHAHNMYLHMDGARIANAAVALNLSFREFTRDCGVDVLSFGGTKNGLMFGEAVVFFNKELSRNFVYFRKQCMQLHSKMRFIAVQYEAYLKEEIWKKNATQANSMAQLLAGELSKIEGFTITEEVQANGVFVSLPKDIIASLQEVSYFHMWREENNEVRLMCSFDTTEQDIYGFVDAAKKLL